jgi:hypothetical protein
LAEKGLKFAELKDVPVAGTISQSTIGGSGRPQEGSNPKNRSFASIVTFAGEQVGEKREAAE